MVYFLSKLFLYTYIFVNLLLLIIYFLFFVIYKGRIAFETRRQILSKLFLPLLITFFLGFIFRSSSADLFTETFVQGKWFYDGDYVDQDLDTGEDFITREKEYLPKNTKLKKYIFLFDIFAYLFWIGPGLLHFNLEKKLKKEKNRR